MREEVAEYTAEIERLKKINNDLQQSQSLLKCEHDQLKQEHQKVLEDNRNQVSISQEFMYKIMRSCDHNMFCFFIVTVLQ